MTGEDTGIKEYTALQTGLQAILPLLWQIIPDLEQIFNIVRENKQLTLHKELHTNIHPFTGQCCGRGHEHNKIPWGTFFHTLAWERCKHQISVNRWRTTGTNCNFNISSSYSSTAFSGAEELSCVCASYTSSDGWVKWRGKTASSPCNYQTLINFLLVRLNPTKQQKSMSYQTNTVRSLIRETKSSSGFPQKYCSLFPVCMSYFSSWKIFSQITLCSKNWIFDLQDPFFFPPLKSNPCYVQNPKALIDVKVDLI